MAIINVKTLNTKNYQHERGTIGGIVTDISDIEQCLETICNVQKGTVVHNPNLGWDILKFIDKPINTVKTKMKQELLTELNFQEPRVQITNVEFVVGTKSEEIEKFRHGNLKIKLKGTVLATDETIEKDVTL